MHSTVLYYGHSVIQCEWLKYCMTAPKLDSFAADTCITAKWVSVGMVKLAYPNFNGGSVVPCKVLFWGFHVCWMVDAPSGLSMTLPKVDEDV